MHMIAATEMGSLSVRDYFGWYCMIIDYIWLTGITV